MTCFLISEREEVGLDSAQWLSILPPCWNHQEDFLIPQTLTPQPMTSAFLEKGPTISTFTKPPGSSSVQTILRTTELIQLLF